MLFEELGPVFVKVGQELSIRSDLLPEAYTIELMLLRDQAAACHWSVIERVITDDLGRAPRDAFRWVNTSPIAAGALTQVHLALTQEGQRVAVKVQRPDIAGEVDRQLNRLDRVHRALTEIDGCTPGDLDLLRSEIQDRLNDALDFERELRNTALLHSILGTDRFVRTPAPYPEYSGQRVLTTEYLDGVPLAELLALGGGGTTSPSADLGIDRHEVAENLVRMALQQAFTTSPFHVAPHPGNLIALPGNQIALVDFSGIDEMDDSELDRTLALVAAVYADDTSRATRAVLDLVDASGTDRDALRADFVEELRRWRHTEMLEVSDAGAATLKHHLRSVMQVSRRRGLPLSSSLLASYRAMLAAESVANLLSADSGLKSVGRSFFVRQQIKGLARDLSFESLQGLGLDVVNILTEGPGQLWRLVDDLADDRFVFRVATTESDDDRDSSNRRARLIAMAIMFVGVAILATGVSHSGPVLRAIVYVTAAGVLAAAGVLWVRLR